jgi:hypothetical protein
MQCACAILSSVVSPALQYFYTLTHKPHDFLKIVTEHKMCFDFLYNFCLPPGYWGHFWTTQTEFSFVLFPQL